MTDAANTGASQGNPADPIPGPQPPPQPISSVTVLLFEVYFLLLGVTTAYALWSIWPYKNAPSTVQLFGLLIDFKNDSDARLLLLAMLAGGLGALVHVTTSFATYLGNREFDRAWVPWFTLRPLIGMTLGLLFYLIARAGLVTTSGADAMNPFGVGAISGLAGLFSKQTVDKLRDVFEQAFPVSKGGDKDRKNPLAGDKSDAAKTAMKPQEQKGT